MNREETLARFQQAQNEGIHIWNDWANKRLEERKRLEEAGEWEVDATNEPQNQKTKYWFIQAEANFSNISHQQSFEKKFNCSNFIFPSTIIFENAKLNEICEFKNSVFHGKAIFNSTSFFKSVTFWNAIFFKGTFFNYCKFKEKSFFSYSQFKGETDFTNCIFNGPSTFSESHFFDYTIFDKSTFHENSMFYKSKFNNHILFNNCVLKKPARFDSILCEKNLLFNGAKLKHAIGFSNSIFKGICSFRNLEAATIVDFKNSIFEKNIDFSKSKFDGSVDFSNSHFKNIADFSKSSFANELNFSSSKSESAFTLENTKFTNQIPNFIQANFKEAPRLDNIKIEPNVSPGNFLNSITTFIDPDIKARYQALKRLAIQAHDHENEQRFWAGELRSDRSLKNEDGSWNRRPLVSAFWWGNIAYGFFSDYGRSIVRPLISLFILLCIMTNIHLFAHNSNKDNQVSELRTKTHITKQSDLKDCDIRSSAFRVAAKNGAIGLLQNPAKRSIFERDYACLYGTYNDNKTPKIPNSIFWIEILHTLFSAILIFLTLLGIRNNFKLK